MAGRYRSCGISMEKLEVRRSARSEYQEKRLSFLNTVLPVSRSIGLEIGACDKPTVPKDGGLCRYADFRSANQMVSMWGLDPESVCHVDYVIRRSLTLPEQITDRFDYVIACHVLEHVPDPIGYLFELSGLLNPNGTVFLAIPDKRITADINRPSTTIDHLIMDFHDRCRYPSVEHIMDFHRHWIALETGTPLHIKDVYNYAQEFYESGEADVHCHVWDDRLFREQFQTLSDAKMLGNLELTAFQNTPPGFNEFVAVFTAR